MYRTTLIFESKDTTKPKKKTLIKLPGRFKNKSALKKSQNPVFFTLKFPQNFEKEKELTNLFWESACKLLDCFLNFIHDLHSNLENDNANTNSEILKAINAIIKKIETLNYMDEKKLKEDVKDSLIYGAIEQ